MDEDYGVHTSVLPPEIAEKWGHETISMRQAYTQRRFFCSDGCQEHWLERFPWPEEWIGMPSVEVEQQELDENNQPVL